MQELRSRRSRIQESFLNTRVILVVRLPLVQAFERLQVIVGCYIGLSSSSSSVFCISGM